jgi:hypothetical protein
MVSNKNDWNEYNKVNEKPSLEVYRLTMMDTIIPPFEQYKVKTNSSTWTWDTYEKPEASIVKRRPYNDQICNPVIVLLASKDIELTVWGTKLDNAIPPALHKNVLIFCD